MLGIAVLLSGPGYAMFSKASEQDRRAACAHNLSDLWKMQMVYRVQYGGRKKAAPPYTGEAFWLALTQTKPPLIDPEHSEIFSCPVKGKDEGWGTCDYRGPAAVLGSFDATDPVGADLEENHGAGKGGMVLLGSGDVKEAGPNDAEWKAARTKTLTWRSARKAGDEAIPALIQGLRDADPLARWGAAMKLAEKSGQVKDAAPALALSSKDKDFMVRLASFRALGKIGAPAVPALVGLLKEKEGEVRRSAATTLGSLKSAGKDAVPALLEALGDTSSDAASRGASAEALGSVGGGDSKIISALIGHLGDKESEVAVGASFGLGQIGVPAVPPLVKILRNGKPGEQTQAAWAVAKIGAAAKDAVPALIPLLAKKEDEDLGWAVAAALGAIGEGVREAFPALVDLGKSGKGEAKAAALSALAKVDPAKAVPVLIEALKDRDPNARYSAVRTLGDLGPVAKDALPALAEAEKQAGDFDPEPIRSAIQKIRGK